MAIQPKGSKVTGSKKKDKITWVSSKAWKKALTVNASSGNDVINFKKSKYKNKLNGQNGNDTVYGGTKYDTIHGNAGNDKLYGYNGNDKIYGDSGKDTIYGGNNNDYINGGNDADKLYGQNGNDTIYAGKGNDSVDGGNNNDKIYGQYGTNTLKGGAGNDSIYGGTGTDKIYAGSGNDYVNGGNGNDIIYGNSGTNTLIGGAGNDSIYGGTGDDIITAGKGNDIINAGSGNNIIKLNVGDGIDTIISGGGTDTLDIGPDNEWLYFDKRNNDLVGGYIKSGVSSVPEEVVLKDYFIEDNPSVKFFRSEYYTEGSEATISDFGININGEGTIIGTKYKDDIYGSDGDDEITAGLTLNVDNLQEYDYIEPNGGNDIINIQNGGKVFLSILNQDGNDTVNNAANAKKVYIYRDISATLYGYQDGSDYKIVRKYTVNGEEQTAYTTLTNFTLADHPDIVQFYKDGSYTNLTAFDLGDDYDPETSALLNVPSDTNTLTDTSNANLYILGSNAGDTISTGTGNDVISALNGDNEITSSGGSNRILAGTGDDTITVNGSGDNYIEVAGARSNSGNEITINSTGTNIIKGCDGRDQIEVNAGTNYIYSNGGQDTITLNAGTNTVDLTSESYNTAIDIRNGDATILGGAEYYSTGYTSINGGTDAISVTGGDKREDIYILSGSDNTVNTGNNTDYVTIIGGSDNKVNVGNGNDGVTIQGGTNNIDLGDGDDNAYFENNPSINTIAGGNGRDTITVSSSSGISSITIYGGSMTGEDDASNNIRINTGSAEIHAGSAGDYIGSNQYDGVTGITVYGGAGNDSISAGLGVNQISGGLGNDSIRLDDSGEETLIFNCGDGIDTIYYSNTSEEGTKKDILNFADTEIADLLLRIDPNNSNNLMITYNNGEDKVILKDCNSGDVNTTIEKIVAANGTEEITFEDFLSTRSIYDLTNTNEFEPDEETNGVYFTGTKFSDRIEGTEYDDTIWAYYSYEGEGNDSIYGYGGNDSIQATYGNNTIEGGTGNDTISMNNFSDGGVNTAIFGSGDGMDRITNFGANSVLKFNTASMNNINISSIFNVYDEWGNGFAKALITYNNNETDGVILDDVINNDTKQVNIGITTSDETKTLAQLLDERRIILANSSYRRAVINNLEECDENYVDSYVESKTSDENGNPTSYITTTDGNDYVYTSSSYNTIEGGKGNDTIESIGYFIENDYGRVENKKVEYNTYVINIDESGNGDGEDIIINDNTVGWNEIVVKGIGTDKDDKQAQKDFINSLNSYFQGDDENGYDLVIEYGNDLSKLIFKDANKEDLSNLSTSQFRFVYKNNEGKYNYGDTDTYSTTYDFRSNLYVPVNISSGGAYIANTNYSEVITGDNGWEAVTLNGYDKIVDMKSGRDFIIVKSDENSGTYTVNMGSDTIADTIWFSDITDSDKIYVDRYSYYENGETIYTNDLEIYETDNYNAKIILKDYFTYAGQDNGETVPAFMKICYGEDGLTNSEHQFNLTEKYNHRIENTEGASLITGTCFNDYIETSNDVADFVFGGAGNDTIEFNRFTYNNDTGEYEYNSPMADTIFGGSGDDSIYYTDHNNSDVLVVGGIGDDIINISAGTAEGWEGSDSIYASYDNARHEYHSVSIYGFSSAYEDIDDDGTVGDYLQGGDEDDYILGSKGNDTIFGGDGNDTIRAGSGNDTIKAGNGDDYIEGGNGADVIYTNYSRDNYETYEDYTGSYSGGDETVYGGDGNDTILAQGGFQTITGGAGDDSIVASYNSYNDFHFNSGDGNDVIYTSDRNGDEGKDVFFFDDITFDGENIKVEYYEQAANGYPENTLVIFYDKNGSNWNSSIQVRNYAEKHSDYDNETGEYLGTYHYSFNSMRDINSSLDKIVDQNGNEIYIRDMIDMNLGTLDEDKNGTIFNDTITDVDGGEHAFYGNYGSDSIIGSNDDNYLCGYDSGYSGWGRVGDGNDYIDGKNGRNNLYGGWGNDTLVGGYDSEIDKLYGGYGSNTYDIQRASSGVITAEIHSSSDKDTLIMPISQFYSFEKSDSNLIFEFQRNSTSTADKISLYDWYNNPRDFRIKSGNTNTTLYNAMKSSAPEGVEFGTSTTYEGYNTQNTTGDKIYLGTPGDDNMMVLFGTTVCGGLGNDSICANYAPSTIYGGEGNDTIKGSNSTDTIYGGDGRDSIEAGSGDDVIYTANKSGYYTYENPETSGSYFRMFEQYAKPVPEDVDTWDYVQGGAGNDTIFAIGENANLLGDEGNDTYHVTLDNISYIHDCSGTNDIVLHTFYEWGGETTYLVMDVNSSGYFNDNGVMLMSYDGFRYWQQNAGDLSNYNGGYVTLSPFKVGGQHGTYTYQHIGTVTEVGGSKITGDQIGDLKQDIEAWLSGKYTSVSDALANGTADDKEALIAYFTEFNNNAWQYNS